VGHHFVGGGERTCHVFVGTTEFDLDILAFSETKLAKLDEKNGIALSRNWIFFAARAENADARDLVVLLRPCRQWMGGQRTA
jgi:hypothetical protein